MKADMLLLAERLVSAVETISQDVKNMSAYVYDLNYSVSLFINGKKGNVGVSVVTSNEYGSLPCDPPSFADGEYSLQCDQLNDSPVPHIDDMEHEEMSVQDVGCVSKDEAVNSDVLASFTAEVMTEGALENEENGMDSTSDSDRHIVRDVAKDMKDEIDIHENWFPFKEESDDLFAVEAVDDEDIPKDMKDEIDIQEDCFPLQEETGEVFTGESGGVEDSTNHTTRCAKAHDSIPETQKVMSASGLRQRTEHRNDEETNTGIDCLKPPEQSSRASGVSFSGSGEKLREHDAKIKEYRRDKDSGAGDGPYRVQKKEAFARKSLSEQCGRQKRNRMPFSCDTCGKYFSFKSHLEAHRRIHTGERPFCCAICNQTYSSKSHLVSHLRVHSGERPYKCSSCEKSFKANKELKRHRLLHSREKPFECRECGRAFNQSDALNTHMRIHKGKKQFICRECGYVFTNKSNLNKHLLTHSGERPYPCKVCGCSFTQSGSLTRHKRIVHGIASSILSSTA